MRILFLDDMRVRHQLASERLGQSNTLLHAYTADDLREAMSKSAAFDLVYLDHDLNMCEFRSQHQGLYGMVETTGMHVVDWIIGELPREKWPKQIIVHSHNPAGKKMAERLNDVGIPTTWELFKHG